MGDFIERERAISSFFQQEGASMPAADEMFGLAKRRLGVMLTGLDCRRR